MELDIDNIADYYSKMRDQELIRIATQNARGLRPEVFDIIEKEIKNPLFGMFRRASRSTDKADFLIRSQNIA